MCKFYISALFGIIIECQRRSLKTEALLEGPFVLYGSIWLLAPIECCQALTTKFKLHHIPRLLSYVTYRVGGSLPLENSVCESCKVSNVCFDVRIEQNTKHSVWALSRFECRTSQFMYWARRIKGLMYQFLFKINSKYYWDLYLV